MPCKPAVNLQPGRGQRFNQNVPWVRFPQTGMVQANRQIIQGDVAIGGTADDRRSIRKRPLADDVRSPAGAPRNLA